MFLRDAPFRELPRFAHYGQHGHFIGLLVHLEQRVRVLPPACWCDILEERWSTIPSLEFGAEKTYLPAAP